MTTISVTDMMLNSVLTKAHEAGVLDSFKTLGENSPRDAILLKLSTLHVELGGSPWDSLDAAEKRLDVAIAKVETKVSQ